MPVAGRRICQAGIWKAWSARRSSISPPVSRWQSGDSVRVESFTGAVNNPPQSLLWSTDAIWRNAGDKAILRNKAGVAVSTDCYGDACP